MKFPRRAGILLHITSLPGSCGIGDLGEEAGRFADFLVAARLKLWQILPLNPNGPGNCPYSSPSAFAGNPLLISPERLVEEGLIDFADLPAPDKFTVGKIDYRKVIRIKSRLIDRARKNFEADAEEEDRRAFNFFCEKNAFWLDDYALFTALKGHYKGASWFKWPGPVAGRDPAVLEELSCRLSGKINETKVSQYLFFRQWSRFRRSMNRRGIKIAGDIPFFVSHDSSDVWASPELFLIEKSGRRTALSGVPPPRGGGASQIWGNPLYDWEEMADRGFGWWRSRFAAILDLVDIVRVDHFSGFYACWHVPTGARSSKKGKWVRGPGADLFDLLQRELGALPIIAEALEPQIEKPVDRLMKEFAFPGVRELQFGLEGVKASIHSLQKIPQNCVLYPGIHDNNTSIGWIRSFRAKERRRILNFLGVEAKEINWGMIRAVFSSIADTAIIPLQDALGLGSSARMNIPGRAKGQWEWRFKQGDLTASLATRLANLVSRTGR